MKLKSFLSIVLAIIMSFGMCSVAFAQETVEIPEGYTPIYTAEDLHDIRNNLAGKYMLMNDIDLSVYENWEPIGAYGAAFTGQFDGNGFTISSLTINADYVGNETVYYGLFGYISGASDENIYTIKNLVITNASVDVKCSENATAKTRTGILVGFCSSASVFNCAVTGKVCVEGFLISEVGGIVGRCVWSDISRCVNYADVNASANSNSAELFVGGISGIAKQSGEQRCCNYGNISVKGENASKTCIVKMGGIDGDGSENISLTDSYNRGDLSVDFSTPQTYMGGISGESYISENTYSCGQLIYPKDFDGYAGAVAGNLFFSVLAIGLPAELKNAYYTDKENIPAYDGESIPDDFTEKPFVNVKLLNEEELANSESFAGFDFEETWAMEENGYPVLQNQPEITVKETVNLKEGETYPIKSGKNYFIETDTNVTEPIAEINENYEIEALEAGTATITVEHEYNYKTEYLVNITRNNESDVTDPNPNPDQNPNPDPNPLPEPPADSCPLADWWIFRVLKSVFAFIEGIINNILDYINIL